MQPPNRNSKARSKKDSTKRNPPEALEEFFGANGPASTPSQVDHTGIYLGRNWMIHSSSQGVTLVPFAGWYVDRFAWARRPLREAGLS